MSTQQQIPCKKIQYDERWLDDLVQQLKQCPLGSPVADKAKRMIDAAADN